MNEMTPARSGRTGARVELARYSVRSGDRVLYGQRIFGVVRVTDVPLASGGRSYLIERGLEEEGANANAALQALIADYLQQASALDEVPMAVSILLGQGFRVRLVGGHSRRAARQPRANPCVSARRG